MHASIPFLKISGLLISLRLCAYFQNRFIKTSATSEFSRYFQYLRVRDLFLYVKITGSKGFKNTCDKFTN